METCFIIVNKLQTRFAPSVSELRKAKVDTYSAETCQAKYTAFVKNAEIVQINQDMLCAGNQHADTCAGKVSSSMTMKIKRF